MKKITFLTIILSLCPYTCVYPVQEEFGCLLGEENGHQTPQTSTSAPGSATMTSYPLAAAPAIQLPPSNRKRLRGPLRQRTPHSQAAPHKKPPAPKDVKQGVRVRLEQWIKEHPLNDMRPSEEVLECCNTICSLFWGWACVRELAHRYNE